MENIKEITKNTLFELKNQNLNTTPENYFIEFKYQADKSHVKLNELQLFDEIKNSLTKEEKKELKIESFNKLAAILIKRTSSNELKSLVEVFDDVLSPSFNTNDVENIRDFISEIIRSPKKLTSYDTISKLKEFTHQRIDADKKVLQDKTDDIIKITSLMSKYLDKTLDDNDLSTNDILKIKDDLINLNILNSPRAELKMVQEKLMDTIHKMESSVKENKNLLSNNIEKFKSLNNQIESLQKKLILAKEEQQFDFLTTLLNRRSYHEEVKKIEKKFLVSNTNFALIFIDIDHFKNVNDLYGHSCGDAILKNFAQILKDSTKKDDILSRYGGEEFIVLMHYQDKSEIQKYVKEIKTILSNYIFLYKNQQIQISFSAGVAFRNNYENFEDTQDSADELLYKAKNQGRNKIVFDNELEL